MLAFAEFYRLDMLFRRLCRLTVPHTIDCTRLFQSASHLPAIVIPAGALSARTVPDLITWCLLAIAAIVTPTALAEDAALTILRDQVYVAEPQDEALQSLDLYVQESATKQPVVLYIHGGYWVFGDKKEVQHKPAFFTANDFAFISMNYRLRWDYTLYDQLEDVVSTIRWIHTHSDAHNLDAQRITLIGHGAGGHLASLVATNPAYLAMADLDLNGVKAVVTIDTFSFDIPRVMAELGSFLQRRQHEVIFGKDEDVWREASPISHLKTDRATPQFALIYPADNLATTLQTQGFARDLVTLGHTAIMIPGPGEGGSTLDTDLGKKSDPTTRALLTFLRFAL
jgi:acetyl esterase/lipase